MFPARAAFLAVLIVRVFARLRKPEQGEDGEPPEDRPRRPSREGRLVPGPGQLATGEPQRRDWNGEECERQRGQFDGLCPHMLYLPCVPLLFYKELVRFSPVNRTADWAVKRPMGARIYDPRAARRAAHRRKC